jgi:hypothetical protein
MPRRWRRVSLEFSNSAQARPVPIVADAAIATRAVGEGRLIPLLIIDTASRSDIEDLVRAHAESQPPGDVDSQWAQDLQSAEHILLVLQFRRPIRTACVVRFPLAKYAGLIDQIIESEALYLQAGRPGDRLASTMDHPRILLEIADTGFRGEWEGIYLRATQKELRARGLGRKEARRLAPEVIANTRLLGGFRMRPTRTDDG